MPNRISWLDWAVMISYAAILIGIALYHWRKLKNQDDVFLAGRSMSRWPVAISMYMALFSTNSFIGLVGWLNRPNGTIWIIMQNVGIVTAVPLVILLFPSLYYRIRIRTAYEYLERRFNYSVRAFASVFFMAARIMWMSTMLYAASLVISMMLGWTTGRGFQHGSTWSILLLGSLGMFFALAGGMHAVIWTDVMQFFVLVAGVATMAYLAIQDVGGIVQVVHIAREAGKFAAPNILSVTDEYSLLGGFLLGFIAYLSNGGSDQLILQTYLSSKSEREIKASLWRNGLILKPFSITYPILGLLTFVYYHAHPSAAALMRIPDDALPVFVIHILPAGARGLMIAAIMSALLTSLEGGMASLSATLQIDFIRRLMKRPLSDRGSVRMGRMFIFLWGAIILCGSVWIQTLGTNNNILQILNIVMYPFVGVLLGMVLLGMLNHRANAGGTLIGAAGGFLVTVMFPFGKVVLGLMLKSGVIVSAALIAKIDYLGSIASFFYGFLGFLATMVIGSLASFLFRSPAPEQIRGLTRFDMPPPYDPA
jgi:SSS family transporter